MPSSPSSPPRRLPRDVFVAICVAVVSVAYIALADDIRNPPFADPLGPRAFPYMIGGIGVISALWLLLETLLRHRRERTDPMSAVALRTLPIPVIVVTAWSVLFFFFFEQIGFPLGGTVYMLVLTSMLNRGQWRVNIIFSVVVTLVMHFSFKKLLGVPLPDGPIWF